MSFNEDSEFVFQEEKQTPPKSQKPFYHQPKLKQIPPPLPQPVDEPHQLYVKKHFSLMEEFITEKIMIETMRETIPKTLRKKNAIEEHEELPMKQLEMAGREYVNNYIDKLEIWLKDSIFDKERIRRVSHFTEEQKKIRSEKVKRIHQLAKAVGEKRANKIFQAQKEEFRKKVCENQIEIEQDPQQKLLMKDLMGLKMRVEQQNQKMKRLCISQDY